MDIKEKLMVLTSLIAFASLIISYFAYRTNKSGQEHSLKAFDLEYSNTLLAHLDITKVDGHRLETTFKLLNHGDKNITIKRIQLTGRALSSVGEDYGILNDTFSSGGPKPLKANSELKFDASFVVGYGELKTVQLMAYIHGINAKHENFEVALPIKVAYA
jgi:hypothetical protein